MAPRPKTKRRTSATRRREVVEFVSGCCSAPSVGASRSVRCCSAQGTDFDLEVINKTYYYPNKVIRNGYTAAVSAARQRSNWGAI